MGGIEQIYTRRWGSEKMVCVKPRDPRVGFGLGAFTAVDFRLNQRFFGTGLIATINHSDRTEQEIFGALAYFSAGRCAIG